MKVSKLPIVLLLFGFTAYLVDMLYAHIPANVSDFILSTFPVTAFVLTMLCIATLLSVFVKGTKPWRENSDRNSV